MHPMGVTFSRIICGRTILTIINKIYKQNGLQASAIVWCKSAVKTYRKLIEELTMPMISVCWKSMLFLNLQCKVFS